MSKNIPISTVHCIGKKMTTYKGYQPHIVSDVLVRMMIVMVVPVCAGGYGGDDDDDHANHRDAATTLNNNYQARRLSCTIFQDNGCKQ